MSDCDIKQVIVMRTDLNMRKGKMIAQGAHASIAFLTDHGQNVHSYYPGDGSHRYTLEVELTDDQMRWINGIFKKICVRVDSEKELLDICEAASEAGLTVNLIQDAGLTEFGGVLTYTCCAIGPNDSEVIDKITGELKLL